MPVAGGPARDIRSSPPLAWEKNARIPRSVSAVLAALRFSQPAVAPLRSLTDAEWNAALAFADNAGLTLVLGARCRDQIPQPVQERIDTNLGRNTERVGRMRAALVEIAALFQARQVDYLLLKGFSQEIDYVSNPYLRVPYDIDLFLPEPRLAPACALLATLGYESLRGSEHLPTDHLPPMVRKTGWHWRGDFYDPEIPAVVELHFRFWDALTERFAAPGTEDFWARRVPQDGIPVLNQFDRLAYAALHLLRHLLRARLRPYHAYEIAYFLNAQADNDAWWKSWRDLHAPELRRLQCVAFLLAEKWFGCRLSAVVEEELARETMAVSQWFERYGAAPLEAQFHPNKHEMWLHFALLDSPKDRRRVFFRRMFPATIRGPIDSVFVPEDQLTLRLRARRVVKYAAYLASRVLHHARAVPPVITHGVMWKARSSQLEADYWRFLLSAALFNLGLALFFLLYNLFLLDLGYRENVIGLVAGAFTLGNLAGVLPAGALTHRWGLKRTLLSCFGGTAAVVILRLAFPAELALLASAFAGGAFFSLWAVCLSPVIAALTSEAARPAGFSLFFSSGIGLSVLIGIVGGRLPGWMLKAGLATTAARSKQIALLASAAFAALAVLPLARLRLQSPPGRENRTYPNSSFIRQFLIAIAVWSFATGLFNPLFNAYFSRALHMPVEKIGLVYSTSQALQVAAILAAPWVLRRLGLTRGVAVTQLGAALALGLLASSPAAIAAAGLYAAYLSFQYMSDPGIFSSLMSRVTTEERSGASAMNFLVMFAAQALAPPVAGFVIARSGYGPMLAIAAIVAAVASLLFWRLPH